MRAICNNKLKVISCFELMFYIANPLKHNIGVGVHHKLTKWNMPMSNAKWFAFRFVLKGKLLSADLAFRFKIISLD